MFSLAWCVAHKFFNLHRPPRPRTPRGRVSGHFRTHGHPVVAQHREHGMQSIRSGLIVLLASIGLAMTTPAAAQNAAAIQYSVADSSPVQTLAELVLTAGNSREYGVALSAAPIGAVRIELSLGNNAPAGTRVEPAALTFTTANYNEPKKFRVIPGAITSTQSFLLDHVVLPLSAYSSVSNQSLTARVVIPSNVSLTLSRDNFELTEGASDTYTVQLNAIPDGTITITPTVAAADVSLLQVSTLRSDNQLVFTPTTWSDPQTVTVQAGTDDAVDSGMMRRSITIMHTASSTAANEFINTPSVTVTRLENDRAALVISPPETVMGDTENSGVASYTVALMTQPTANVEVTVSLVTSNQYVTVSGCVSQTAASCILNFATNTWNNPQRITVTVGADAVGNSRHEHIQIRQVATSTDDVYAGLVATASVIFTDSADVLVETVIAQTILPEVGRVMGAYTTNAIANRIQHANSAAPQLTIGGQSSFGAAVLANAEGLANGTRGWQEILGSSNFVLPLNGAHWRPKWPEWNLPKWGLPDWDWPDFDWPKAGEPRYTMWGGGDYHSMSSQNETVPWQGWLLGTYLGGDVQFANGVLTGLAFAWSESEQDYVFDNIAGTQKLKIASVHPYLGHKGGPGELDFWATVGYGDGELSVNDNGIELEARDVALRSTSIGSGGQVMKIGETRLRLKGEVLQTQMDLAANRFNPKQTISGQRVRLLLEGRQLHAGRDGRELAPSVQVGYRHDGGDGPNGSGVEITAGLRYTNPGNGITLHGNAHFLVGRSDFDEWGLAGMVRVEPGAKARGLALSLQPSWGQAQNGVSQMWSNAEAMTLVSNPTPPSGRLAIGVGYGIGQNGKLVTPYSEISLGTRDNNQYRLGMRWQHPHFNFDLASEQSQTTTGDNHAILLKGRMGF